MVPKVYLEGNIVKVSNGDRGVIMQVEFFYLDDNVLKMTIIKDSGWADQETEDERPSADVFVDFQEGHKRVVGG